MQYKIGEIIQTKKNHACGNNLWEIKRVGVDFKLMCIKCKHLIILDREKFLKYVKQGRRG